MFEKEKEFQAARKVIFDHQDNSSTYQLEFKDKLNYPIVED